MISAETHSPFRLSNIDELKSAIAALKLNIGIEEDLSYLTRPLSVRGVGIPNSMAIQPMEGADGTADGAPDVLTFRRYKRFAEGGAGLLWVEACAVVREGRANPRQLWIHKGTKDEFARMVEETRAAAAASMGKDHRPFLVLQLTHSGRYSRPGAAPSPIIAHHDPLLDKDKGLPADYPLITDAELDALQDAYVEAAKLAFEVGFDAVDVKACHRYLLNELLAAHTREGKYGGSYENRTRFIKEVVGRIFSEVGKDRIVTTRLGIHDAHPYPHGWGMDPNDPMKPNLDEPKRLVKELQDLGMPMIDITMGNPYFNPHINRPFDRPIEGMKYPNENPLIGVDRLVNLSKEVGSTIPDMMVIGSGLSWLRNLWPYVAAANIRDGWMDMAGLGRQGFAYPWFAKEIINTGKLERRHTCIACSSCTQIMRDGGKTGCVPFDKDVYGPMYREGRRNSIEQVMAQASRCRDCFDPTCKDGCPAGVDIPGFVTALASGDIKKAYEVLRAKNALPEMCAYVCPADVQCQGNCVEGIFSGNPVQIRELQKYVTRVARQKGWTALESKAAPSGKKVAVIGAGPAGLACASVLLHKGHKVDLYDLKDSLGGVAAGAIPGKRLTRGDFEAEVSSILQSYGEDAFKFIGGRGLDETTGLDNYINNYDAVFLGTGLGTAWALGDSRPWGVEDAITFLETAKKCNPTVPARVAVLGGGNTAMDAATTAVARGAQDVYIIYRRSLEEMPAWPADRQEALDMGVHFLLLTQPVSYRTDEQGKVTGLVIARTILGEPDASGRRRPVVVPNSESVLEVDLVLEALGQGVPDGFEKLVPGVSLNKKRLIQIDDSGQTTRKGVFAGGDAVNGGTTVVQAVAEGMKAAEAIDQYMN